MYNVRSWPSIRDIENDGCNVLRKGASEVSPMLNVKEEKHMLLYKGCRDDAWAWLRGSQAALELAALGRPGFELGPNCLAQCQHILHSHSGHWLLLLYCLQFCYVSVPGEVNRKGGVFASCHKPGVSPLHRSFGDDLLLAKDPIFLRTQVSMPKVSMEAIRALSSSISGSLILPLRGARTPFSVRVPSKICLTATAHGIPTRLS